VPECAVRELIRIGKEPVAMQMDDVCCSFIYEDGSFLRTQLVDGKFPDMAPIFDKIKECNKVKAGFFENLEKLVPFLDKQQRVFFTDKTMSTSLDKETGCHINFNMQSQGLSSCFNLKHLLLLKGVVRRIDMGAYPAPVGFYGNKLRGVIIGMKVLKE
jgi:hypothetical protein